MYTSYSKLSKNLKNSIKIKVGHDVLALYRSKTNILIVLICNLKTTWPSTKILSPFLSSLNNFFYKMHYLFFKKVIDYF